MNPTLDAQGERIGGWACCCQLINIGAEDWGSAPVSKTLQFCPIFYEFITFFVSCSQVL